MSHHAVLWLDHTEAKVFHVDADALASSTFQANNHNHHVKHGGHGEHAGKHHADDPAFWRSIATALQPAEEVLVVGPGNAKANFLKWVGQHDHGVADKVVSVETVDHPTDNQLVAYARKYFRVREKVAHG